MVYPQNNSRLSFRCGAGEESGDLALYLIEDHEERGGAKLEGSVQLQKVKQH